MSIDTMPQQETAPKAQSVSPAIEQQQGVRPPRLSNLVAERARMQPGQLRTAQRSLGFKLSYKAVVLGSMALPFLLNPVGLAIAAGIALYQLGKYRQRVQDRELFDQLLKNQTAENQATQQPPVAPAQEQEAQDKAEPLVDKQQVPEGQQAQNQDQSSRQDSLTGPWSPAQPVALHLASRKAQREGKRKGIFRTILAFIVDKFKKMFNRFRENHTIKGLQEKVFNLETQAAEINAHYDQQIAYVEKAVRQGIEDKFDFDKLDSIEGKDQVTIQQDKATAAALHTALEQYRNDTGKPNAQLSEFLFEANRNKSLVDQYKVPKHVMDEVAKSADSIEHQKNQIEGYRENELYKIEAQRAPAVQRLQTKLERRERRREALTNFKAKLQAGKEKLTGALSREAGYAR